MLQVYEDQRTSSHKGVLDGGEWCPLSTHLGTNHYPFVTPGIKIVEIFNMYTCAMCA